MCPAGRHGSSSAMGTPACSGECPAGRWGGPGATSTDCSGPCVGGHACPPGLTQPNPGDAFKCPVGQYSPVGLGVCAPCSGGYYGSATGLEASTCTGRCPAGFQCPEGSVTPAAYVKGGGSVRLHLRGFPPIFWSKTSDPCISVALGTWRLTRTWEWGSQRDTPHICSRARAGRPEAPFYCLCLCVLRLCLCVVRLCLRVVRLCLCVVRLCLCVVRLCLLVVRLCMYCTRGAVQVPSRDFCLLRGLLAVHTLPAGLLLRHQWLPGVHPMR
jgi:hypothetical protein